MEKCYNLACELNKYIIRTEAIYPPWGITAELLTEAMTSGKKSGQIQTNSKQLRLG